ncbi:hypothetical protein CK227_10500 [Mesorhizobium sp. WSM4308]|uniref:hypothetical protein n=1 Tax=Mesorhizobium sp. WSM4308 TaxID=2029409 RepID=UPI000BB0911D|nr:hypothetical protein [Mesorhizobium sp. WSM4308]PBB75213.1 hypothetical protein CK227_10500 [Mesorhizobium sp. WSM4308]
MSKGFVITSGEDWAETAQVTDDTTNGPLTDIDTALIELQVQDACQKVVLGASSADGSITKPASGQFTWRFTAAQMAGLPSGATYKVASRMTLGGKVTSLFLAELVVRETGFTWQ